MDEKKTPDDHKIMFNELYEAEKRFYELDPISRLHKRIEFETKYKDLIFQAPEVSLETSQNYDLFAIYDSVCRRGGFARVQMLQRWQEISNSLKYLNLTEKELVQIYQTYLLKFEKNFFDANKDEQIDANSKTDRYFIPYVELQDGRYFSNELLSNERELIKRLRIDYIDVYLCLRNVILCRKKSHLDDLLEVVPNKYHVNFIKIYKWLITLGVINLSEAEKTNPQSFELMDMSRLETPRKVVIIGANLRGFLCARLLKDYGFHVDILDKGKLKGVGYEEEGFEYIPFAMSTDPRDPVHRFLQDTKIKASAIQSDSPLVDDNGVAVDKSTVDYNKDLFFEILHGIWSNRNPFDNFRVAFEEELQKKKKSDPRMNEGVVMLLFSKLKFDSKLNIDNLNIGQFNNIFLKYNKSFITSLNSEEKNYVLTTNLQCLKDELTNRKVKIYYEQTIEKIEDLGDKIGIQVRKANHHADFLIFCSSPHFVVEQIKKSRGEEKHVSKDPINISSSITDHFSSFKEIEPFQCSHVLLCFEKKLWDYSKDSVMLLGEEYNPFFMVIDLSKNPTIISPNTPQSTQQYRLLVYLKPGHIDNIHNAFDTTLKTKLYQILPKIFPTKGQGPDAWKEGLSDYYIFENQFFNLVHWDQTENEKKIHEILNPCKRIYFNIPISHGVYYDRLRISLMNAHTIIGDIMSECLSFNEYNENKYEKRLLEEKTIGRIPRKKTKPEAGPGDDDRKMSVENTAKHEESKAMINEADEKGKNTSVIQTKKIDGEMNGTNQAILAKKKGNSMDIEQPKKLYKKKDAIKSQSDPLLLFGVTHPLIEQTNRFIASMLKEDTSPKVVASKYIDYLELREPFKIIKNFYIYKMGMPYSIEKSSELQFNNGFASWRLYKSFLNKGVLVYFYQAILYLEQVKQTVYVIIPEDHEEMVLFHNDLGKLFRFISKLISEKQKDVMHFLKYKKSSKKNAFVNVSNDLLRRDILNLLMIEPDFDILLQKMYERFGEQKKISDEYDKHFVDITSVESTIQVIESMVRKKLKELEINRDLSLGEILFGLFNPKTDLLLKILGRNRKFSLENVPSGMREYFKKISNFCEIDRLCMEQSEEGQEEDSNLLNYRLKRMFLDWNDPLTECWLTFEVIFKRKARGKSVIQDDDQATTTVLKPFMHKMTILYQISSLGMDSSTLTKAAYRKDVVSANTATECAHNLIKKIFRVSSYRRNLFDYIDQLLSIELREYKQKEKVLKLLMKAYTKPATAPVPSEESVAQLENFLKKKYNNLEKISALIQAYKKDGNIKFLGENHRSPLIVSFSSKPMNPGQ